VASRFAAGPYTLWTLDVGLACCAVEVVAASLRAAAVETEHRPDVLVVAGTLTDKMAPGLKRLYDSLPDPKYVVSFGACSNSGGPYWDSYSVTKGVDQLIPVDVYVPGCPPRPEALLDGLRRLEVRA
jgi:NADH-quinone oxidoreductase subunit B